METPEEFREKIKSLEEKLSDYENLINAIKSGEVDAFAINNPEGQEVYTLQSGDYAYRLLIEKFSEGALNLSESGLIVYSNMSFPEYFGLNYATVVGTDIFDYVAEESKALFMQLFSEAKKGSSKGEIVLESNGKKVSVNVSLTSLMPHLSTIGVIVTDLTEKKRNQQLITTYKDELVEINERLLNKNRNLEKQIFKEFSESFEEYKTGVEFFNSLTHSLAEKTLLDYAFIGELEYKKDELFIKTLSFHTNKNKSPVSISFPVSESPCREVLSGSRFAVNENASGQFKGSSMLRKFEVQGYVGYPLFDIDKKVIGVIAVMSKKKIDDLQYSESLLQIAARRAEIEMQRLNNEKRLAEANAELKSQNVELASFSYIASHDLQEPLRKIQAFTSRILQKESDILSPAGLDYFNRIINSAARMQLLIQSLLAYSRTNTSEIKLETVDLNMMLEEVKKDLHEDIQLHGVAIESRPLPTLKVINHQFRQLLTNIISNAIKYRNNEIKPVIKINEETIAASQITENPPAKKYSKISIEDNGIGFEKQHEFKVFELFQRLHSNSEYDGTGIGLAICKKIMQNHNGLITAEGRPGKGATFNIYIPVND